MIGLNVMKASGKEGWAGAVIAATVLVVAGCDRQVADQTALPATPTPAASPAGTRPAPATVTAVEAKDVGAATAPRAATPAAQLVATLSPAASPAVQKGKYVAEPVIVDGSSACTNGLDPMRLYASNDVARWTADGSHILFILFTYNRAVWAVTADGSRLWRLARSWREPDTGSDYSPGRAATFAVTLDSKEVVYATCAYLPDVPRVRLAQLDEYDFDYELAGVGLDGKAPRRLTRHEAFDDYPAWSPDGTRVAFVSNRDAPDLWKHREAGLYTMAADGADVRHQAWSPDGRSIAVAVGSWDLRKEGHALYLVHADGAGFVRLAEAVSGGSWSPDGTRLAFAKPEDAGVMLYTIAADGSDARRVTTARGWQPRYGEPDPRGAWIHTIAWSPDGSKLLYPCGPEQFCVVTVDGGSVGATVTLDGRRTVGANPLLGDRAVWPPDGARIAVARPPAWHPPLAGVLLYTAAPDGSDRQTLTWQGAGLVAAQAKDEGLATSRAACAAGFVVPAPDSQPGLVRDCATLLAARAALFGGKLVNWGSGVPLDLWGGVTIAGSLPRVNGLDLFSKSLSGSIPAALGGLDHLQALALSNNGLAGPIPPELGALRHLTGLLLGRNRLTGPIPPALGQLTSFKLLHLAQNGLTGPIPAELGQLTNLKRLHLAGNRLTGCIPSGLRQVPDHDLAELGLPDCEAAS